jgi:pseudo-rSAM protein
VDRGKKQNRVKKKYWFFIENYVHISIKKGVLLLYNSLNGRALDYSGRQHQKIFSLVKRLQSPKNLQVILLTEKDLQEPVIAEFVLAIRNHFMGDLIDTSFSTGKPVQMMPIINIKENVKRLKKETYRSVGENMKDYLTEIFLYINNGCLQDCKICNGAYKQFPCCATKSQGENEIEILKIKKLFWEIKSSSLVNLNILGGNIFMYSKFKELTGIINHLPAQKIYYAHYLNVTKENNQLKFLNPRSSSLKILVPFPVNEEKLKSVLEIVMNTRISSKFVFILQSEEEFEKAENLISSLHINDHEFQPFFNGKNLDFFMEGVFTEKEEILASKPEMKDIYANSVVNSLNFGRLTILSNGHIHANVNASRLGILGKDSIYDILYKIRKNVEPCKNCTFCALCPPLSNYSYAIGRNNLCHMKP